MPARIRLSLLSLAASATVLITTATTGTAAPAATPSTDQLTTPSRTTVSRISVAGATDTLARQLAESLSAPTVAALLTDAATRPVNLSRVTVTPSLAAAIHAANAQVLAAKGLPADSGGLLRIRLAASGMRTALARGEAPLIAATPTDDTATTIDAYGQRGEPVRIDARRVPNRPIFLVDVDVAKAAPIGLRVARDVLAARHVSSAPAPATIATSGYWATKVTSVWLNDDEEPWFKGGAEIYSIVGGFGLDGLAKVDIVQMPYLDSDHTTYYPNQLLVHFSSYKYNLADVVMMEDDGDTNYQQLATAIAAALLTIVDGGVYIPLVNAIISAIPTSWWTDDPDYVDSWYTLATSSSGRRNGAAGNGRMDITPYWVAPL